MFTGRRRLLLGVLALLGFLQAVLTVGVGVLTPRILTGLGGRGLALGLIVAALIIGGARIAERVVSEERLSADAMNRHPAVPWSLIKRMRDRLAHRYEGTDYEAVWDTLVVDLPTIRGYLAGLDEVG